MSACAPPQEASGRVALTFVPSIVPSEASADFPVKMRRLFPDCEICNGEPNAASTADLHASACTASLRSSTFQVPSTETGAASFLPAWSTPARASRGKPTRRMYATTKFRLVRDMNLNPRKRIKKEAGARAGFLKIPAYYFTPSTNRKTRSYFAVMPNASFRSPAFLPAGRGISRGPL